MKKTALVLIVTTTFFACKNNENNGAFKVTGHIENATSDKIYLEEMPFAAEKSIVIDSATLKNGKFELNGIAHQEGLYALSLLQGPRIMLVNDSKNIDVKLDVNRFKEYEVKGSKATVSLKELFTNYESQYIKVKKAYNTLDSLQEHNASDSALTIQKLQRNNEMEKLNTLLTNFVTTTESPAACLQALVMSTRTMPLEELQALALKAVAKFKDNENVQKFNTMLKGNQYPLLNQQAPDFTLNTPEGKPVSLSSFKGKYVLVDFWASWCKPCRMENPTVVAAYNKYKDKNFTVFGVSLDSDKKDWEEAIEKDQLTWTHVSDLLQWETPLVELYKFDGIPFNVLIDPSGKIIATGLRGDNLEKELAKILK